MTRAMTREHLGTSLRVLAGLLVSALRLWLAFREVPLEELSEALARANYWWLLPAAVLLGGLGLGAALAAARVAIVLLVAAEAQAQVLVARLAQHLPARVGRLLVVGTQQVIAGLAVLRQPGAAARAVAWSLFIWLA